MVREPETNSTKRSQRKRPLWWRIIRTLMFTYLLISLLLMFFETRLVYPAPGADSGDWTLKADVEQVELKSTDGTKLVAWIFEKQNAKHFVVYFYGNGENIAHVADKVRNMRDQFDATVMTVDYRGYGKSEGSPHEAGILKDGISAVEFFAKKQGLETQQIVLIGRSLGGSVAVHAASQLDVKALVVESSFDSLVSVAAGHFWWLPVRWLMRNRFQSEIWAAEIDIPVLQFHGTRDRQVPLGHAQNLHKSFKTKQKEFVQIKGGQHNDATSFEFYKRTKLFLQKVSE